VLNKVGGTAIPQEWKGKDEQVTQGPGADLGVLSSGLTL